MKSMKILAVLLAVSLLWGCSMGSSPTQTSPTQQQAQVPAQTQPTNSMEPPAQTEPTERQSEFVYAGIDTAGAFTERDRSGSYGDRVARITLSGTTASCDSSAVRISGGVVTIIDEGTYVLSGTLSEGMILVDAAKEDKVQLVLDGAHITCGESAPIYIRKADKVFITLAAGSENTLANGGGFTAIDDNNIDAVIFSKDDLTLNGTGSLLIQSPAGHGVVSKDELTVAGGVYTITAASHGLEGKDNVCITQASLTIDAGKDGIHSENDEDPALGYVYIESGNFAITCAGDGISAGGVMQIDGGTFSLLCGGGSANAQQKTSDDWGMMGGGGGMRPGGMGGGRPNKGGFGGMAPGQSSADTTQEDSTSIKAIKSTGAMVINDGTFSIDAADDALHANDNLTVTGGSFTIATGDDGFHADKKLTITGGTVRVSKSYEGLEGQSMEIGGGDIALVASDDGLNAAGGNDGSGTGGFRGGDMFASDPNCHITISGGKLFVNAAGDGIDSNGNLNVTGGYTVVEGPTAGANGALDYNGNAAISGGTLIVTGSMQMAQSIGTDGQGVIALNVGSRTAGTAFEVLDQNGKVLISAAPSKAYACVVLSTPEIISGQSYTIRVGEQEGTFRAN